MTYENKWWRIKSQKSAIFQDKVRTIFNKSTLLKKETYFHEHEVCIFEFNEFFLGRYQNADFVFKKNADFLFKKMRTVFKKMRTMFKKMRTVFKKNADLFKKMRTVFKWMRTFVV